MKGRFLTLLVGLVAGLMVVSCTKRIYLPEERIVEVHDTVTAVMFHRDSVTLRDSIMLTVRGDTVVKEVWRYRDRERLRVDTVVRVVKEATAATQTVAVEKKDFTWWKIVVLLVIVLVFGVLLYKRKF